MKSSILIALFVSTGLHTVTLAAEPKKDQAEENQKAHAMQFGKKEFRVATLLHQIYEYSLKEEKIKREQAAKAKEKGGKKRKANSYENLVITNQRNFVKSLGELIDLDRFEKQLSKNLKDLKKASLGPKHPDRRWVEVLLKAIETHRQPAE